MAVGFEDLACKSEQVHFAYVVINVDLVVEHDIGQQRVIGCPHQIAEVHEIPAHTPVDRRFHVSVIEVQLRSFSRLATACSTSAAAISRAAVRSSSLNSATTSLLASGVYFFSSISLILSAACLALSAALASSTLRSYGLGSYDKEHVTGFHFGSRLKQHGVEISAYLGPDFHRFYCSGGTGILPGMRSHLASWASFPSLRAAVGQGELAFRRIPTAPY